MYNRRASLQRIHQSKLRIYRQESSKNVEKGRNIKMKLPSAEDIRRLTQKLKTQGDVTLEEAELIYSPCRSNERYSIFNSRSNKFNRELTTALEEWHKVVAEKIKAGQRGNFIFTVNTMYCFEFMQPAHDAIREYGSFKDLCNVVMVDKKLYSVLPCKILFRRINPFETSGESYYEMRSTRAGMLYYPVNTERGVYTALQFIKNLSPVISATELEESDRKLLETVFEIAAGTLLLSRDPLPYPMDSGWVGKKEIKALVLGSFMKYKGISCAVASDIVDGRSVFLVERKNVFLVKEALEIPFEDVMENALQKGIISKEEKEDLLGKDAVLFPGLKFIDASVKYIDDIVQTKMQWKAAQEEVEDENDWLDEIK